MAYNINHRRHIADYFRQFGVGTTTQIVKALPKAKRTPTSYSTINQCLIRLIDEGSVRRVGPGCYAPAASDATPIEALSRMDEVSNRILQILEARAMSSSSGVSVKEIYKTLEQAGFSNQLTHKRLLKMESLGVITKTKFFGRGPWHWSIKRDSYEPTEWRDGAGFAKATITATKPRAIYTPYGNGIAGESVPAHNILRRRKAKQDPILTKPVEPAAPEQFTVPTPGREPSIFD